MSTLLKGRIAAALMFAAYGIILGAWTSRIPSVKQGLHLTDGQLSLGLLGFAAGAITGMQLIGRLVDRYGGARIMIPMAIVDAAALVSPAFAPNLGTLIAALFVFGAAHGTVNIAMNGNAVEVERAWQKPIMSSFHAVYSIGGFLGAAIGGLCAQADLGARTTFMVVAITIAVMAILASRWAYTERVAAAGAPAEKGPLPGVYFLALLAFCCLVGEGAAADWSTVYVRDTLHSGAGFAAAAYAAFSIMMTVGRLVGDRLAARLGTVTLVRASGVLAAVSLGVALLVNDPVAGVVGFGFFGAGLSCIAPLVFSAAGSRNPQRAGQAIARVASLGWIGFLIGPIVIGGAAELVGLSWALTIPVALALFVGLAAAALRADGRVHGRPVIPAQRKPTVDDSGHRSRARP
jgi:MFS family permease